MNERNGALMSKGMNKRNIFLDLFPFRLYLDREEEEEGKERTIMKGGKVTADKKRTWNQSSRVLDCDCWIRLDTKKKLGVTNKISFNQSCGLLQSYRG
jgi:CRISPR/Cas system-associated endonuclease Cas3-HD